jgi:sirohydrochlorin ferrochelatase
MRLVVAVHGTRSAQGQAEYEALRRLVAALLPTVDVRLGYLDVQQPDVAGLAEVGDVVVPVLLARGFHVRVDCAALASRGVLVGDAVGPHPALVHVLDQRLAQAGAGPGWPVVLVAAGSRDPAALADLRAAAIGLASRRRTRVELAMASCVGSAEQAVERLRREAGGPVAAASWFVAPGSFASAAAHCGADVVGRPIGACAALAGVVVSRYDAARGVAAAAA